MLWLLTVYIMASCGVWFLIGSGIALLWRDRLLCRVYAVTAAALFVTAVLTGLIGILETMYRWSEAV